jgi:tetratricopeptide (TPR) repeat protein
LPGLGDNRLGASQLPANSIGDRRDALNDRLGGGEGRLGDRTQGRDDRQQNQEQRREDRPQNREDRQQTREQRREDRPQNREDRQQGRDDRQQNRQQNRDDRLQNRDDRLQGRQDNWNDVRNDWQDRRDQLCGDWQQCRDDFQSDWQGYFDDHYGGYSDWYSGYAPEYWGGSDPLWDDYPVAAAAGLTWWGANALGYGFGYSDYSNPYYTESMPAYYNEPIITTPIEVNQDVTTTAAAPTSVSTPAAAPQAASPPTAAPAPGGSSDAVSRFDQARAAFYEGRYDEALKLTDAAVAQMPHDAVLHEFRSLVLFALQRYAESAATIYPVLQVGPGWDWKTLSGLYASTDTYTQQLRALEAARNNAPNAAEIRFLLGYHYLTCGFTDQALSEFRKAHELRPKDSVAAALVAMLSPRDARPTQATAGEAPKPVPSENLIGIWTAAGKGAGNYAMTLNKDGSFTWGFTRGGKKQEVKGVHTVEGNVLAMEPDTGGVMLAELTQKGPDSLHFKMIGGASNDPGLDFRREASTHGK